VRPKELLNPDTLPEDLHWLAAEYRLQPNDPVYLLIAWHWSRVQQGEDTLRAALMELKAAVDSRVASVVGAAETVSALQAQLTEVQAALEQKPVELGRRLEAELQRPVTAAVTRVQSLERSCLALLQATRSAQADAQRRQSLAVLLIGIVVGACGTVLFLQP
jgi:chromosome segregation ATPase